MPSRAASGSRSGSAQQRAASVGSSRPPSRRPRAASRRTASSREQSAAATPDPTPDPDGRRSATAAAAAATVARVDEEGEEEERVEPYTPLQAILADIFNQGQKSTAGHKKQAATLRNLFDQCFAGRGRIGSTIGVEGRQGEKIFVKDLCRLFSRALVVKKSEAVSDRCFRLVDMFLGELLSGGSKPKDKDKDNDGDVEMEDENEGEDDAPSKEAGETSASRVVLRILNHLLSCISARERVVRYRTTQLIGLVLSNSLAEFPVDHSPVSSSIFRQLRSSLLRRMHDKEAIVRVQAAIGLTRLMDMGVPSASGVRSGDSDSDADSKEDVVDTLIEVMQNDSNAEVRRTILFNIAPTPITLPYLLERSRDVDAQTRRGVFNRLIPKLGDFRHLSIRMREKLLRWGLNDRDEYVRRATKRLFYHHWLKDTDGDLLEVLERLDVSNEPIEEGPKYMAMRAFWEARHDVLLDLELGDPYWSNLTPEGAFLVRTLNDYGRSVSPQVAQSLGMEERIPEVTRLAYYLAKYMNKLLLLTKQQAKDAPDLEFIVLQLILISMNVDYGDEIGRRKMFSLYRETLAIPELPELVTKLVVDSLKKLTTNEGEYSMIILEAIAEIHDTIVDDDGDEENDSFHSAQSDPGDAEPAEDCISQRAKTPRPAADQPKPKKQKLDSHQSGRKRRRGGGDGDDDNDHDHDHDHGDGDADMMDVDKQEHDEEAEAAAEAQKAMNELVVNLKCLHISQCMLENISGELTSNSHLVTMLNGLVVPAVRSHDAPVREAGLRCLGLSCLLDRQLTETNLGLFIHVFNRGHEKIQVEALYIISDILLIHGSALLLSENCNADHKQLYRMFEKGLAMDDNEEVQSVAVAVLCKLMLAQVIKDEVLLKKLVKAYFDPATSGNLSLRQTLAYFFPVYCHSNAANAALMASITVSEFHNLFVMRSLDEDDEEMVPLSVIASHFMDWTDPRKTVLPRGRSSDGSRGAFQQKMVDATPHAIVCRDALERICSNSCNKEERKLIVSGLVGKCYIPKEAGRELLREIYDSVTEAIEGKVVAEALGRNTLAKVEVAVGKLLGEMEQDEGEATVVPGRDGGDSSGEEGEGEEEEATIVPENRVGNQDEEAEVDHGEESERTPAVTEDEG